MLAAAAAGPDIPAWVQAIGSVVAIGAGFYYIRHQVRHQQEVEKHARVKTLMALMVALMASCRTAIKTLHESSEVGFDFTLLRVRRELAGQRELVIGLDLGLIDDDLIWYNFGTCISQIDDTLAATDWALDAIKNVPGGEPMSNRGIGSLKYVVLPLIGHVAGQANAVFTRVGEAYPVKSAQAENMSSFSKDISEVIVKYPSK